MTTEDNADLSSDQTEKQKIAGELSIPFHPMKTASTRTRLKDGCN
jgi:hypothetical protein